MFNKHRFKLLTTRSDERMTVSVSTSTEHDLGLYLEAQDTCICANYRSTCKPMIGPVPAAPQVVDWGIRKATNR